MTTVSLTINDRPIREDVESRTHLADFLRERLLLTGTHLGCEHGVCGACTVLLDGEPVRACITYALACEGRDVRTIEGLDDDPIAAALRAAFTAEHGLQCGYCTPGMMATARDIVLRCRDIDDDGIRLELSGNLCRCTGYVGIVRAIRRVLDAHLEIEKPAPVAVPSGTFAAVVETAPARTAAPAVRPSTGGPSNLLTQSLPLDVSAEQAWRAVNDPALIAACVPGARLMSNENGHLRGELAVALGPIQARFGGEADLVYDDATRSGHIAARGRDPVSGTRLGAEARFFIEPDGAAASTIRLEITYALQGPLAQFGRGPIVQVFAAEISETVARNLAARLRGETAPAAGTLLGGARLMWRVLLRWIGSLGRSDG